MYSASDRHLGIFQYGRKPSGHSAKHVEELLALVVELRARIEQLEGELADAKKNIADAKRPCASCREKDEALKLAEQKSRQLEAQMKQNMRELESRLQGALAAKPPTVLVDAMSEEVVFFILTINCDGSCTGTSES